MPTCSSALLPPSPPSQPGASGAEDVVIIGVLLCEAAVILIALGANIQRYALAVVSPDVKCFGGIRCGHAPALCGARLHL